MTEVQQTTQPTQIDLLQLAAEEEQAYTLFHRKYTREHPMPVKPTALGIGNVGFMFWVLVIQAMFSVTLAAMRTAEMFRSMALAGGADSAFATAEAFASVFTVEVGLVVFAAALVKRRHQHEQKSETKITKGEMALRNLWLWVAIVVMLLMSAVAGLGQSTSIVKNIDPTVVLWLQWGLAIILGLGASFIAYVSGEILGEQLVYVSDQYDENMSIFNTKMDSYNQDMEGGWLTSSEYAYVRNQLDNSDAVRSVRSPRRRSARSLPNLPNEQRTNAGRTNQPTSEPLPITVPPKTQAVIDLIVASLTTYNVLPEVRDIAQQCNVAKSTASELRTDWGNVDRFLRTYPDGRVAEVEEVMASCNLSKAVAFVMRQAWMSIFLKAEEQQ